MNKNQIFDIVKSKVLEILDHLDPNRVTMESSLKALGANSIDRVEVTMETMEELGLRLHPNEFQDVKNIQGLVDTLHRHLQGT